MNKIKSQSRGASPIIFKDDMDNQMGDFHVFMYSSYFMIGRVRSAARIGKLDL